MALIVGKLHVQNGGWISWYEWMRAVKWHLWTLEVTRIQKMSRQVREKNHQSLHNCFIAKSVTPQLPTSLIVVLINLCLATTPDGPLPLWHNWLTVSVRSGVLLKHSQSWRNQFALPVITCQMSHPVQTWLVTDSLLSGCAELSWIHVPVPPEATTLMQNHWLVRNEQKWREHFF